MTTKRIRCSCGRVYDPVKRPACPDCGAPHVAAASAPAPEAKKETPPVLPPPPIETKPVPHPPVVSPQIVAIGVGILLLLIIVLALSRCGRKPDKPASISTPVSAASLSPDLTPTPNPAPSVATAAPTAPIIPPPTASPLPTSTAANSGLTSDLAGALASAAPGATIKLPPGIYPGGLVLTKAVRIVGGVGQVFIQSDGRECISVRARGVAVQNVQFIGNGIGELPAIAVMEGGELELDGCKINSTSAVGVSVVGKASIKAIGSAFVAVNGKAMHLDQVARGSFTQCLFGQSHHGIVLENGATAELHSCAFDADGGNDANGQSVLVEGAGTTFTADDCHFTNNTAGVLAGAGAQVKITKSSFKGNAAAWREGTSLGLVTLDRGARGTLTNDTFEANRQGVVVSNRSSLEMEECRFSKNGGESREFFASNQPISVIGTGTIATVRKSVIADSEQAAAYVVVEGKLILEEMEISGSNNAGLIVGDRNEGPGMVEIRRSHFLRNALGMGILAGGSAIVEDSEFRENQDGILVVDPKSHLQGTKLTLASNSENGISVRNNAHATMAQSDIQGNARGAASGMRGKASERGFLTLEDCRFSGNRTFAAGAYAQSELTLTRCVFDGSDKTNVYKERGAVVQNNATPPQPAPVPQPTASQDPEKPVPAAEEGDDSSLPSEQADVTPSPESTASPSPHHEKSNSKSRRKATPRPRPPTPEDVHRLLRRLLPGGR